MPSPDHSDQRIHTAYHEAGHAVLAIITGRTVNKVTIIPGGNKLGVCKMSKGRKKASPDALEAELLILLAGLAAEGRKSGRYNMQGAAQDLRDAEKLALLRAGNPKQATKVLKRALDKVHHHFDQPVNWIATKSIAQALLESDSISGREADHLYKLAVQQGKKNS
ncbi:MAG: cell division protein FtsH [Akkermansiaceae bacterium]